MIKTSRDWHWIRDDLPPNIIRVLNDRMARAGFPLVFNDEMALIDFAVGIAALVAVGGGMHLVTDQEAIRDELLNGNG